MSISIELIYADGTIETHAGLGAEVTIGKSAEASLRVERVSELAPLQLLLVARRNGVWVSDARGAQVVATRDGKPVGNSIVPWGTEIDVGSLTVRVRRPAPPKSSTRTVALVAGLAVIAAGGLMLSRHRGGPELPSTSAQPPRLLDDAAVVCPDSPQPPGQRAAEMSSKADAKETRYPFAAHDGIEAVELYRMAAACYEQAKRSDQSQEMAARGADLARRLEQEYRATILQQRRALRSRDLPTVLATTGMLKTLLDGRTDPYTQWLAALERHVTAKVQRDARKKSKLKSS
jgi:hypothetical protein